MALYTRRVACGEKAGGESREGLVGLRMRMRMTPGRRAYKINMPGMRRHQGFTTQVVSIYHVRRQPLGVVWCGSGVGGRIRARPWKALRQNAGDSCVGAMRLAGMSAGGWHSRDW